MGQERDDLMLGVLGAGIRERRQAIGLTLKDVAAATGLIGSGVFDACWKLDVGVRTLSVCAPLTAQAAEVVTPSAEAAAEPEGEQRDTNQEAPHGTAM